MASSPRPPKDPLIVVIGATGTGKSKLAIQLATRFNGEIINGDAMQMYQGLPVITNKIPQHERNAIPHHLLDFIGLEENPWTVTQFVKESSRVVSEIRSRGRLPILVGGTHYYTHALLFRDALLTELNSKGTGDGDDGEKQGENMSDISEKEKDKRWSILTASTEDMYAKLQEVDPVMAATWHPRDSRRIQRSLEIWLQTGRKASDVYAEQQQQRDEGAQKLGREFGEDHDSDREEGGLRYSTLLFWLDAEDAVLKERLNSRVDSMVKGGLFEEALSMAAFERNMRDRRIELDKGKGIWVSIGYKEMERWIDMQQAGSNEDGVDSKLASECIEAVKAGTRQYAKRQTRYIRLRLANALKEAKALDRLFILDCTELDQWKTSVTSPSEDIAQSFLAGDPLPNPSDISVLASRTVESMQEVSKSQSRRDPRHCPTCDKMLMNEKEWQGHLSSRSHKKMVQRERKLAKVEADTEATNAGTS